jgi:5-methylcytosine-specific restriction protein B
MDVALRRRFTFEELMPDAGIIREVLRERIPHKAFIALVADLFVTLNDRIRFLYDRDHQLGHSYFLDLTDVESLRLVFRDRLIPMLQEYFYGAWHKICIVLGCPYDEVGMPKRHKDPHLLATGPSSKAYAHPIITARTFPEVATLGFDHDDYEDRVDYQVRGAFQHGGLSPEDLYRTFLGVLALDAASYQDRLAELLASGSPASTTAQPASGG